MTSIPVLSRTRLGSVSIHALLPHLLLAGSILVATGARAQAPTLVEDIYPGVSSTPSTSAHFDAILGTSGGKAFLNGSDNGGNVGVWVTDGTVAGTRLLVDYPGRAGADVDGTFFFGASTWEGGSLWKSDGTAAGTSFVSRFSTDPTVVARILKPTKVGSRLFFVVDDGVHGAELWTSDGTTAGTRLVKDVTPGPAGSFDYTASLVDAGGALLFSCSSTSGCGLWRSDGTEAGTVPLADPAAVSSLVYVNSTTFFTASDATHGPELWKSDGTVSGTVLVRDILPGAAGSRPNSLVPFGGALYFRLGSDGSTWKSDGTEAGTVLVHTFPSSDPLVPSGSFLFTVSGSELWASDGTEAGTSLVRDFGVPLLLTWRAIIPGALLFWVDRGVDGLELCRSDGTTAGTTRVEVLAPGDANPFPLGSVSIPGATVHLVANMSFWLWRSDGTAAGTFPLQEPLFDPNDGLPMWLADANGTLFFSAVDADHGNELWRSDGTPGGTVLVKDINPGQEASSPGPFFASPSTVFFTAWTPATGRELYRTDGTGAGTTLVKDVQTADAWPQELGLFGELFLYTPDDGVHGREPWRSDGTPDGTFLLGDLTPGPASSNLDPLGVLNGEYYLAASNGVSTTLWKTDGTVEGTIAVGPMPEFGGSAAGLGGTLVFSASDAAHGTELWKTDGTAAGTSLLRDINPSGSSWPGIAGRLGNGLFFWADDGTHGVEPWVTDGTATGTTLLKDVNPGPAQSGWSQLAALGSALLFWAHDGVHGSELWKSDGTPAGTVLVRDIASGPPGSKDIQRFVTAGHEVLFTASDHVSGREPWRSDGTESGTKLVADLVPGMGSGAVDWSLGAMRTVPVRSGGRVFFSATDGTTGYELWSVPVPTQLHTIVPCRVADTRDPAGPSGGAPLAASATLVFQVTGRCGIPATAISVAANVTVVSPSAAGSLSVFAGIPIPTGPGEVFFPAGKTRALHLLPNLGTSGTLSVRPSMPPGGDTHVVLDVSGYFE